MTPPRWPGLGRAARGGVGVAWSGKAGYSLGRL